MRKLITTALAFLAGLFFILEFLIPAQFPLFGQTFKNPFTPHLGLANNLIIVIGTMAFLLGPINLIRAHAANLFKLRPNWSGSLTFLLCAIITVIIAGGREMILANHHWGPVTDKFFLEFYNALFLGVALAFGGTSMAILTFYLVGAAFRSFRLSNLDSAVMMIAAAVVLLGTAPVGDWITQSLPANGGQLWQWSTWIMTSPNTAVQRAVTIGAYAGAFAAAMRFWLGIGARTEA